MGSASPRPLPGSSYQLIVSAPLANSYKGRVYICGECFAKTTTRYRGYQLIVSAPLANSYKGRVYICGECFAKTTTR